jgi:hypothetical protein
MKFLEFYTNLNSGFINEYRTDIQSHFLYSTDKQNHHDYIVSYYDKEFSDKKQTPIKLMEIGILNGNSLRVWSKWFENLELYGVDNWGEIPSVSNSELDNVKIITGDAYNLNFLDNFQDDYFDYIIDDGPHTTVSQVFFVDNWISKIKSKGKLILEDVYYDGSFETIKSHLEKNSLIDYYNVFDFRSNKTKYIYDSVIIEIIKK